MGVGELYKNIRQFHKKSLNFPNFSHIQLKLVNISIKQVAQFLVLLQRECNIFRPIWPRNNKPSPKFKDS